MWVEKGVAAAARKPHTKLSYSLLMAFSAMKRRGASPAESRRRSSRTTWRKLLRNSMLTRSRTPVRSAAGAAEIKYKDIRLSQLFRQETWRIAVALVLL